jgi:hypothetical protein
MHKVTPVLALAVGALLYATREDRSDVPQQMPAIPETTKPFQPEWVPSPGPEDILQGKLTEKICATPNCQGCALDKETLFRKKPGHPKFQ